MKTKFILSILIVLYFNTVVLSQKVTVSDEIVLRNDVSYDLVGKVDSQIVLFRDRGNKYEMKLFNENLKAQEEIEISLADKNCNVLASVPGINSFHVFYGFRHRGKYYIQMDQIDLHGKIISSDTIKIYEDILLNPSMRETHSEDKTKFMFFNTDNEHESDFTVFDLTIHKNLLNKKILFKDSDFKEDFRSMMVTNDGTVISVFEKNNHRSKKDIHQFEIFKFYPNSEKFSQFAIPVKFVTFHTKFTYDNANHHLVGGGVYTFKNTSRAEGVYFISHNLMEGGEERVTTFPFETRFDEEITRRSKDRNEFNQLIVSDIALKQDGGALLIMELKKEYERRAGYTGNSRGYGYPYSYRAPMLVDYYYEDMALFDVDKSGNLAWSNVLHKKQYSHDDDGMYSSYFLFKNPSRLRLIYNDEISTENTVSEYVVQTNGQYQRKSVLSTEYVRLQLRFKDAVQISSTSFLVPSQRSQHLNLVKIEYL